MTVSDLEIFRAAHLHLDRHGDQAVANAREMVRTLKERGDNDGADTWLRIIVAIETMSRGPDGVALDEADHRDALLLVEGASPPDLAITRPVNQASGSGSVLWLD